MWPRLTLADIRIIGHYLGTLAQLLAAFMVVPLTVGLVSREWEPVSRYLLSIGLCLIAGTGLRLIQLRPPRITRPQAVAVTGLAWIALSMLAAIPLWLSGHFGDYLDALFESASGLTTTGVSLAQDLPHLSNADNMWRFSLQLIGGLGLIVVALSLGLFGRRIDASLYSSEARTERIVPNVAETTKFIARTTFWIIAVATIVLGIMCFATGMQPFRAGLHGLWLGIAAFATGGFSPMPASVAYYHSLPIELGLMLLMLLGSLNFALFLAARRGDVQEIERDSEMRTAVLWIAGMTVLFAAATCGGGPVSDLPVLMRQGLFAIVSTFTTTGFQTFTTAQLSSVLPSGALLVLVMLMAVGGCAGGTSGGLKIHRLAVIAKSIAVTCREALVPDSARVVVEYNHFGRRRLDEGVVKEAMTVFVLFAITCAAGALVGVAHGQDGLAAIVDSVVMTCNGGVSSGIVAPDMPAALEAVYLVQMLAGRLEFVTFAAIAIQAAATLLPRRSRRKRV